MHLSPLERDILQELATWKSLAEVQVDLAGVHRPGEVQDTIETLEEHELAETIPYPTGGPGQFIVRRTPAGGAALFRELVHHA